MWLALQDDIAREQLALRVVRRSFPPLHLWSLELVVCPPSVYPCVRVYSSLGQALRTKFLEDAHVVVLGYSQVFPVS